MTAPQIYDLVDMTVNIKADPPVGIQVQGVISQAPQGSRSTFSHSLPLDEARKVGQMLLEKDQELDELLSAPLIFQALLSDSQTVEWFLVPPFFPLPSSLKSTRLRLTYAQAEEYGPLFLATAASAENLLD